MASPVSSTSTSNLTSTFEFSAGADLYGNLSGSMKSFEQSRGCAHDEKHEYHCRNCNTKSCFQCLDTVCLCKGQRKLLKLKVWFEGNTQTLLLTEIMRRNIVKKFQSRFDELEDLVLQMKETLDTSQETKISEKLVEEHVKLQKLLKEEFPKVSNFFTVLKNGNFRLAFTNFSRWCRLLKEKLEDDRYWLFYHAIESPGRKLNEDDDIIVRLKALTIKRRLSEDDMLRLTGCRCCEELTLRIGLLHSQHFVNSRESRTLSDNGTTSQNFLGFPEQSTIPLLAISMSNAEEESNQRMRELPIEVDILPSMQIDSGVLKALQELLDLDYQNGSSKVLYLVERLVALDLKNPLLNCIEMAFNFWLNTEKSCNNTISRCFRKDPDSPIASFFLGVIDFVRGRYFKATESFLNLEHHSTLKKNFRYLHSIAENSTITKELKTSSRQAQERFPPSPFFTTDVILWHLKALKDAFREDNPESQKKALNSFLAIFEAYALWLLEEMPSLVKKGQEVAEWDHDDPFGNYILAVAQNRKGLPDMATRSFFKCLQANRPLQVPDDQILEVLEKIPNPIRRLERSATLLGLKPKYNYRLSDIFLKAFDLCNEEPLPEEFFELKVRLLAQNQQSEEAMQVCIAWLNKYPTTLHGSREEFIMKITTTHRKAHWAFAGKASFLDKMGKVADVIHCWDDAIVNNALEKWPHQEKGDFLRKNQKFKEAVTCYSQILRIDPKDIEAHRNKGKCLQKIDKFEDALKCYQVILKIMPKDVNALTCGAQALSKLGKFQDASDCYDILIKAGSNKAAPHNEKGNALYGLKLFTQAISCYDAALKIDPEYTTALNNKGLALKTMGKYSEAVKCYDTLISVAPSTTSAYKNKGGSLVSLERYEEAVVCFDTVIAMSGKDGDLFVMKGDALFNWKKYEAALPCYEAAIELDPRDTIALNNKGITLMVLARYEKAIVCIDVQLSVNPKDAGALCRKGDAFSQLGKYGDAINCYRHALTIDPRTQGAQAGLKNAQKYVIDDSAVITETHDSVGYINKESLQRTVWNK